MERIILDRKDCVFCKGLSCIHHIHGTEIRLKVTEAEYDQFPVMHSGSFKAD